MATLMRSLSITLLAALACSDDDPCPQGSCNEVIEVLVLQTDYATGALEGFGYDWHERNAQAPADGDAHMVQLGSTLGLLQRGRGDNLVLLDASLNIIDQWNLPANSNPHDAILVDDETVWISLYHKPEILRLRYPDGQSLDPIDLTPFNDADGRPEASRFLRLDPDTILLTIQNLDFTGLEPQQPDSSQVLVLDPLQGTIKRIIEVPPNPFTRMLLLQDGRVALGCNGDWNINERAGIWIFDPTTGEGSFLVQEAQLGGNILSIAQHDHRLYMVVAQLDFSTRLHHIDLNTGELSPNYNLANYDLGCVFTQAQGRLVVCDRSPGGHGIREVDPLTSNITQSHWSTRLAPIQVLELDLP